MYRKLINKTEPPTTYVSSSHFITLRKRTNHADRVESALLLLFFWPLALCTFLRAQGLVRCSDGYHLLKCVHQNIPSCTLNQGVFCEAIRGS